MPADDVTGSPLESPALGASLSSLITPCGDALRPAEPPPTDRVRIGVTLSGGGFRATFAGLGVVRFLADAGLLGDLRFVSSVSGGSVANGMLATRFSKLRDRGFSAEAFDEVVIEPLAKRVSAGSLKSKLVRNVWRASGRRNRTDVLAWAFDNWLFDDVELEHLDPGCRWIFNAANLTTGARFGFERDVVGDYVVGLAPTAGSRFASCAGGCRVGGGAGSIRSDEARQGRVSVRGARDPPSARWRRVRQHRAGGARQPPLSRRVHDLAERRWSVRDRRLRQGAAGPRSGASECSAVPAEHLAADPMDGRPVRGLGTYPCWRATSTRGAPRGAVRAGVHDRHAGTWTTAEFDAFVARFPEHRTFTTDGIEQDLSFVPTVFDRLEPGLVAGARVPRLVADRRVARPTPTRLRAASARRHAAESGPVTVARGVSMRTSSPWTARLDRSDRLIQLSGWGGEAERMPRRCLQMPGGSLMLGRAAHGGHGGVAWSEVGRRKTAPSPSTRPAVALDDADAISSRAASRVASRPDMGEIDGVPRRIEDGVGAALVVRLQARRDVLATALFDVVDVIAGHRWTDSEIPTSSCNSTRRWPTKSTPSRRCPRPPRTWTRRALPLGERRRGPSTRAFAVGDGGLDPRLPRCERGALPTELIALAGSRRLAAGSDSRPCPRPLHSPVMSEEVDVSPPLRTAKHTNGPSSSSQLSSLGATVKLM